MAHGCAFDAISEEVLELILAKLPVVSLLEAGQVCKTWCSIIRSRGFGKYYDSLPCRKPWLFQCCVNYVIPDKNHGYGYDPESKQWHKLTSRCFPVEQDRTALASSPDGTLYSIFTLSDLFYKRQFLSRRWEDALVMKYCRTAPLLGFVDSHDNSHQLIVAGGVSYFEDDDLALEIYDSASRSWEHCESLPREFRNNCSRHWMTSAVAGGKFFVAEIYSGLISSFDLQSRSWSRVGTLRPPGSVHTHLLSCRGNLLLAGSCYLEDKHSFKIWKVNVAAQECGTEIAASMPPSLCDMFGSSDDGAQDTKGEGLQCVASGDLVYVYSTKQHLESQVVVCDLYGPVPQWSLLPPLPATCSFNHMVAFTSSVKIESLF